jgi:hypothetical protein
MSKSARTSEELDVDRIGKPDQHRASNKPRSPFLQAKLAFVCTSLKKPDLKLVDKGDRVDTKY